MKTLYTILLSTCLIALTAFIPGNDATYQIGDKIENFTLKSISGGDVALESYKNKKGIILVFTCNTCPYAKRYESRIIKIHNNYAEQGYPVLAINPNDPKVSPGDSYQKMIEYAKEKGFPFDYLRDKSQDIARKFDASKTPEVFLLKRENNGFVLKYKGGIDDSPLDESTVDIKYLEQAIKSLLNNENPNPSETKGSGCKIKWSR